MINYIKTILYLVIIFFVLLILKRNLFPSTIFYYESIILLIIVIILALILQKFVFKKSITKVEFFAGILTSIFLIYSMLITFPALSKRSISLFMLNHIEKNSYKGGLTQESLTKGVIDEFFLNQKEIFRRIEEQTFSKNIVKKDDKILITKRGKVINRFNNFIILIFNLK